eukprot:1391971-Amorphochlora_amoeboformis.AAC.2
MSARIREIPQLDSSKKGGQVSIGGGLNTPLSSFVTAADRPTMILATMYSLMTVQHTQSATLRA